MSDDQVVAGRVWVSTDLRWFRVADPEIAQHMAHNVRQRDGDTWRNYRRLDEDYLRSLAGGMESARRLAAKGRLSPAALAQAEEDWLPIYLLGQIGWPHALPAAQAA